MFEKLWAKNEFFEKPIGIRSAPKSIAGHIGYLESVGKSALFLIRDRRGVSAVEFAMLFPLMLTMYLGCVQLSQGIGIFRKITLTTNTVANISTQYSSIANADMSNILAASAAIIAPYPTAPMAVTVSGVTIDKSGKATITWSDTLGGIKHPIGQVITLPAKLMIPNTFLVWGESTYNYTPPIGSAIMGTIALKDQIYMSPRISTSIARVP